MNFTIAKPSSAKKSSAKKPTGGVSVEVSPFKRQNAVWVAACKDICAEMAAKGLTEKQAATLLQQALHGAFDRFEEKQQQESDFESDDCDTDPGQELTSRASPLANKGKKTGGATPLDDFVVEFPESGSALKRKASGLLKRHTPNKMAKN
ncbi:hypothetical protein CSIM01_13877 [Colletotrichum simmondsii]|uniref:Uncharacterized protein n=1 Tax=Colletotrichum simmondsii TaxID=703756 RepID=A0A135TJW3_9PEZI|nr:hypothetical protein CSIM01_13877 [Colletotrichum simmondsii]